MGNETIEVSKIGDDKYQVKSGENTYLVSFTDSVKTAACDCKGFANHKKCKHILSVVHYREDVEDIIEKAIDEIKPEIEKYDIPEKYIVFVPYKNSSTGKVDIVPTVLIDGYLDIAHRVGFKKMLTHLTEYPKKENDWTAFAETFILTNKDEEFSDIGDANIHNIKKNNIKPHFPRMAATRALGRTLRRWLFPYVGLLCTEELESEQGDLTVEGKILPKQKNQLRNLMRKFNIDFTYEQNLELKTFVENLTISEADEFLKQLKECFSFDFSDFERIRAEIKINPNEEEEDNNEQ